MMLVLAACSSDNASTQVYGADRATIGESLAILGWNMSMGNLRFDADHVLVDVEAAPAQQDATPVAAEDLRFGLYGALAHPIEAPALRGCDDVDNLDLQPLTATAPDRMAGTVCLGPLRDRSQLRGIYVYSPRDRIAGSTVAYPAAFPVGLLPTGDTDTGLNVHTTSLDAFRADGARIDPPALGDPGAFEGQGYMLIGLQADAEAARYREQAAQRGGPLMVLAGPTLPGRGLSHACSIYGASVLVLPDESRETVRLNASLCTQGEINNALLYATVSVAGTRAALWTVDERR
ncbi:hypothetical protein [Mycobacterium sp. SMC-4]|uniref:hypothetical protein n=1 Tax=Mycobacterium sp. SMC-4 TaxID=2857059 RepID=UPI0037C5CD18